jgi:hypothetical protein
VERIAANTATLLAAAADAPTMTVQELLAGCLDGRERHMLLLEMQGEVRGDSLMPHEMSCLWPSVSNPPYHRVTHT